LALTVAIQMDPIERIDIAGDSTFALALEAQNRGHVLVYYGPRDLSFRDGVVSARVRSLAVRNERGNHFTLGSRPILEPRAGAGRAHAGRTRHSTWPHYHGHNTCLSDLRLERS